MASEKTLCYQLIHADAWVWETRDLRLSILDTVLYRLGRAVPLSAANFRSFVIHRIVNAAEVAEILDCSRQNISDLTRKGKFHPLKATEKNTLYLKSETLWRKWSEKIRRPGEMLSSGCFLNFKTAIFTAPQRLEVHTEPSVPKEIVVAILVPLWIKSIARVYALQEVFKKTLECRGKFCYNIFKSFYP